MATREERFQALSPGLKEVYLTDNRLWTEKEKERYNNLSTGLQGAYMDNLRVEPVDLSKDTPTEETDIPGIDRPFEYDPDDPAMIIPKQVGSIPYGLAKEGGNLLELIAELFTEPAKQAMGKGGREFFGLDEPRVPRLPLAAEQVGRAFLGSGDALISKLKGEEEPDFTGDSFRDRNVQASRQLMESIQRIGDPKYAAEEPVAHMSDVLGSISAAGRGLTGARAAGRRMGAQRPGYPDKTLTGPSGVVAPAKRPPREEVPVGDFTGRFDPKQIAQEAERWDPLQASVEGVTRGARKFITKPAGKISRGLSELLLGIATGEGTKNIREAFQAGLEGNLEPFYDYWSTRKDKVDLVREVNQDLLDLQKGVNYQERMRDLDPKNIRFDISGVKAKIIEKMTDEVDGYNIKIWPTEKGKWKVNMDNSSIDLAFRKKVEKEILNVLNREDSISMVDLDALKRRLQSTFIEDTSAGKAVGGMGSAVRGKLRENKKYAGISTDYDKVMGFWRELNEALSIRPRKEKKTAGQQLTTALRGKRDFEQRALKKYEKETKKPLRAKIAGYSLRELAPSDLTGKNTFMLSMAGFLVGVNADWHLGAIAGSLLGAGASSPRVAGAMMAKLGGTKRHINEVENFFARVTEILEDNNIPTKNLTYQQALGRLEEMEKEKAEEGQEGQPSTLRTLSGALPKIEAGARKIPQWAKERYKQPFVKER